MRRPGVETATTTLATPPAGRDRHLRSPVPENYIKGLMAQTPPTAVRFLIALAAQPGFDRAKLALWMCLGPATTRGRRPPSNPHTDSRVAAAFAGLSQIRLKNTTMRSRRSARSLRAGPASPAAFNNLGVVQPRRGASAQTGRPICYFTRRPKRSGRADYCQPGLCLLEERDAAGALLAAEAVRRNPADGEAHFLWRRAGAVGQRGGAQR